MSYPLSGYEAVYVAEGRYNMDMASGKYDLEIPSPGYKTVNIHNRKISVGVKHRLNLALETVPTMLGKMSTDSMLASLLEKVFPVENGNGVRFDFDKCGKLPAPALTWVGSYFFN